MIGWQCQPESGRRGEPTAVTTSSTASPQPPIAGSLCAFPNCTRPPRPRAGDGGGKPPRYCDLTDADTGRLLHTPLTAARERARQERLTTGGPATGPGAGSPGSDAPASAARDRAASLLEQFRAG